MKCNLYSSLDFTKIEDLKEVIELHCLAFLSDYHSGPLSSAS